MSSHRYLVNIGGESKEVSLSPDGERWALTVDGITHCVEQIIIERDEIYSLIIGGRSYMVDLVEKDWDTGRFTINALAGSAEVVVRDELEAIAEEISGSRVDEGVFELRAPMPGIVVKPLAKPGDKVRRGQGLLVLEAMKMQNELTSEMQGLVQEYFVKEGQMVETGALLARVIQEIA